MRFKRYIRHPFTDTSRKRAHVKRRQRKECEALPLFSAQIAVEQPSVDEVMSDRAQRWQCHERDDRARRAAKWREARTRLASYPDTTRAALRAYWQKCRWPADPGYLLSMLHMFDTNRLVL
jgi:hypothetical protein